ncbi:MAG TPA: sigma-54-dependent Fis family transcriptional regulator [Gammaproteobacteria bacterium]|nr:sigma-54-dependent Fis family transcriptional regulator [Gammaproteobacteria bacterium]
MTTTIPTPTILFVDDDPRAGELMHRFSEGADYQCRVFRDPAEALSAFSKDGAAMIISDLRMPAMTGIELLSRVREIDSEAPFVIVTGYADVESAIEALRLGATDFIKKPFDMDEMRVLVERTLSHQALVAENRLLRRQLRAESRFEELLGRAPVMQEIYSIIDKIADIRCNVIIEGESGTGKELAARAIHQHSQFAQRPFVVIDCGALSDTLLESELFGHEKGAFTGATQSRKGLLETASGGTVFLDEIGNISDAMQIKLLRVVQEQQVTPVGGVQPVDIDVRFIVATNQDLAQMVAEGEFREDLYHRLNVVRFTMPPLRQRSEDIPMLVNHFVADFAAQYHREVTGFDAASMRRLTAHNWPGNVRELRNLVERHIALADGPELHIDELAAGPVRASGDITEDIPSLAELERRYILKLLEHFNDNREKTAAALGINKSTLWRKLQAWRRDSDGNEHGATD